MADQPTRLPGDLLLDRYLPNACEEEREEAREQLREYALHLIRIGERIKNERLAVPDVSSLSPGIAQ